MCAKCQPKTYPRESELAQLVRVYRDRNPLSDLEDLALTLFDDEPDKQYVWDRIAELDGAGTGGE